MPQQLGPRGRVTVVARWWREGGARVACLLRAYCAVIAHLWRICGAFVAHSVTRL